MALDVYQPKTKLLQIRMTPGQLADAKAMAQRRGSDVSKMVRLLISLERLREVAEKIEKPHPEGQG